MTTERTPEALLELARAYQPAAVLLAAAELEVFEALQERPMTADDLAAELGTDRRGTAILADALTALHFLEKRGETYSPAGGVNHLLTAGGSSGVLPMLHHQANCMRSWAQLAAIVKSGRPAEGPDSVRGAERDLSAFIEAMEVASRVAAPKVVAALGPPPFHHLLDIGCGPGTWTIAFLKSAPEAKATVYDVPDVLPITRRHIEEAGLSDRVQFAPGDFYSDGALPAGADAAWISAIVHMNSREENRSLFAKVHAALDPGGRIMLRDIVMEDSHTEPPGGALFAVNMLVRTEGGGTYSFNELAEDLRSAGFGDPQLVPGERDMDSVLLGTKL